LKANWKGGPWNKVWGSPPYPFFLLRCLWGDKAFHIICSTPV
jgi:hypothetical protein